MNSSLATILRGLTSAPITQLSSNFRLRSEQLLKSNASNQEVFDFFVLIYSDCECEVSSFVKALVNPKYTKEYISNEIEKVSS